MRTLTIEIRTKDECVTDDISRLDLVDENGRRCRGLCLGELLEQVFGLCHPSLDIATYPMETDADWESKDQARQQRLGLSSTTTTTETP